MWREEETERTNGQNMGIHGLMKLIGDYAPSAMKENDIKTYFGGLSDLC